MTAIQSPPPFGRHLGVAQRAARALLDEVLAREGERYETWIALSLIASSQEVRRTELEGALASGLGMSAAAVTQLLGQLARYGLLQSVPEPEDADELVTLTPDGVAEYQRLLAVVSQRSAQALAGVAPDELQTTIRVLDAFSQQTKALLAG